MKEKDLIQEIAQIRNLMEKSNKFISISGISGILVGLYALTGATIAYFLLYNNNSILGYRDYYVTDEKIITKLVVIAAIVLISSIVTGVLLARRKARKNHKSVWNASSKSLLYAVAAPLITGGLFSIILVTRGIYAPIASTLLIFYGLALFAGSNYTFKEVKLLGILEIILGLFALIIPGFGILFWATGFGVLHIIYGIIVHKKYE